MPVLELVLLALAATVSLLLVTTGWANLAQGRRLSKRLDQLEGAGPEAPRAPLGSANWPTSLEPWLLGRAGGDRLEIEAHLAAAGYRHPQAPLVFGALRLLAGGLASLAAMPIPLLASAGDWRLWLAPIFSGGLAFLGAKQVLRMQARRRQRRINAELPFTLDILVMMLESGVSIDQAFRAFAQEGRAAPLTQSTVEALVRDIQLGAPFSLALQRWAQRLGVAGAHELASVVAQALEHGAPLARVLREFAAEFAERRVASAREDLGKRSTQMTLAMLLLIMPALFIVLAGPAVATLGKTVRSMSGGS